MQRKSNLRITNNLNEDIFKDLLPHPDIKEEDLEIIKNDAKCFKYVNNAQSQIGLFPSSQNDEETTIESKKPKI